MDIGRRHFLKGTPANGSTPVRELRPPWVQRPSNFTDTCTRCNKCVERCPENILCRGDGGFPTVDFSRGECTFCGECARDCEAELFRSARLAANTGWSHTARVGEQCLALHGVMCRSCEDACAPRAISFPLVAGRMPQPLIDTQACTGCGACVVPCPENAIAMINAGIPE